MIWMAFWEKHAQGVRWWLFPLVITQGGLLHNGNFESVQVSCTVDNLGQKVNIDCHIELGL
jgi:hypothetical protein